MREKNLRNANMEREDKGMDFCGEGESIWMRTEVGNFFIFMFYLIFRVSEVEIVMKKTSNRETFPALRALFIFG